MAKANTARRLLFSLLLNLGFLYLAFLYLAFAKIHSGFLMQLIFLFDALRDGPQKIFSLIFSTGFLVNFGSGLILFYLFRLLLISFLDIHRRYQATRAVHLQLKTIRTHGLFTLFSSSDHQTFASGLFHPRIYLSQKVLTLPPSELLAVLYHEYHHLRSYDPLKSLIINAIRQFLPGFPLKDYLFGYYDSLVEISADNYAQNYLNTKTPLVSALVKFAAPGVGFQSFFSAQSHRLRHLVGEQRLLLTPLFTLNASLILVLILFTVYLSKTNIFYECQHLLDCLKITLTAPHSVMTTTPLLTPDHCSSL